MVASQNGWRANDPSVVSSRLVPGTNVSLKVRNGAPGDLLLAVAARFDREVMDIDNARGHLNDWGYAERQVRGGSDLSNHASGTAIDLNADKLPMGVGKHDLLSDAQVAACERIADDCGRTVRWGGDYDDGTRGGVWGGRPDVMHWELGDGSTQADCEHVLAVLGGLGNAGSSGAPPQPNHPAAAGVLRVGSRGAAVKKLQQVLNGWYPWMNLAEDGIYGGHTRDAVVELQRRANITVDGIAGPQTLGVLGLA